MSDRLKNQGKAYTQSDIDLMIKMFNDGARPEQISEAMCRTAGGVVGKLQMLGILEVRNNGHYYVVQQDPWAMWQDIRDHDHKLKAKEENDAGK